MQNEANCPGFIEKNEWSETLQIWTRLTIMSKAPCWKSTINFSWSLTKTTDELKIAMQTIWEESPQERNKVVANFTKRLTAYMAVAVNGGHYEHLQ